jgi:hypothetical protein
MAASLTPRAGNRASRKHLLLYRDRTGLGPAQPLSLCQRSSAGRARSSCRRAICPAPPGKPRAHDHAPALQPDTHRPPPPPRLQHRHQPGTGSRRGHRRPPPYPHRSPVGRRPQFHDRDRGGTDHSPASGRATFDMLLPDFQHLARPEERPMTSRPVKITPMLQQYLEIKENSIRTPSFFTAWAISMRCSLTTRSPPPRCWASP